MLDLQRASAILKRWGIRRFDILPHEFVRQYLPRIEPIGDYLRRRFYPVVEDVPPCFCHGDPHPLNTIWGKIGSLPSSIFFT